MSLWKYFPVLVYQNSRVSSLLVLLFRTNEEYSGKYPEKVSGKYCGEACCLLGAVGVVLWGGCCGFSAGDWVLGVGMTG